MVDSGRGGSDMYRNGRFMADYSAEQICLKIKKINIKLFSVVILFLFFVTNLRSLQVILYSFHMSFSLPQNFHARGF
jgi:hypothetical protein